MGLPFWMRFRRRRQSPVIDDDDGESYPQIPLVMRPSSIRPVIPVPVLPQPPAPQREPPQPQPPRQPAPDALNAPAESDEVLQLLPGRLEPLSPGLHQEIRFIKRAGITRFTLGRSSGPAYSHIQLSAPTASRLHAAMRFEHGRWSIANLSTTNPVLLNGATLASSDGERVLRDGDRIELGEIMFVFHDR